MDLEEMSRPGSTQVVRDDGLIFHCGIQAFIDRIEYNWHDRYGQVWATGPVDMSGSIKLFEAIDPDVEMICGYLDGKPDVGYRKRGGKWEIGSFRLSKT